MEKRIFIGIPVSDQLATNLHNSIRPYSDQMRLTPPGNYHITVSFVGETEEKQTKQIQRILHETAQDTQPFLLPFAAILSAPPRGEKTMAWATYAPISAFIDLVSTIESSVRDVKYFSDRRKGHTPIPHITLARCKPGTIVDTKKIAIADHCIPVTTLNVYESKLTPQGAKYSVLASCPLSNS